MPAHLVVEEQNAVAEDDGAHMLNADHNCLVPHENFRLAGERARGGPAP